MSEASAQTVLDKPQPGPTVTITIDGKPWQIHRGHQTVQAIKTLGNVPLADELDQLVDGVLTPLDQAGAVTIKGGEQFVSHPQDNGAS